MSYKPYKVNKGDYYTDYKEPKYQIPRLKLFGFRSGIAWKMIPALFYYLFVGSQIMLYIEGEIASFKFEPMDIVLTILKYAFILIVVYSPAIFLSDFEYIKRLPLFKNDSAGSKTAGMIIVIVLSIFVIWTYQYCMSDTYKTSAYEYYERVEKEEQQRIEEYESESIHKYEMESQSINKDK